MKHYVAIPVAAALTACAASGPVGERRAESSQDIEQITVVLKRDFHDHGQAKMDRVNLDAVQRACNLYADNPPADVATALETAQMKTIKFPNGSLMGDWKKGEKVAKSGRGMTWKDKPGAVNGGSCYNCHELSPQVAAFGTLGPSLKGFGKTRGNSPEMQKYAYGKIYNSKAYNACSQMPRLGQSGTLTEAQIRDLVAYLLDPASPVNQ